LSSTAASKAEVAAVCAFLVWCLPAWLGNGDGAARSPQGNWIEFVGEAMAGRCGMRRPEPEGMGGAVQVVLTSSETAGSGGAAAASKHSVVFLFHRSLRRRLPPGPALPSFSVNSCWRRGEERSVVGEKVGRGSES
jgi:hypothetical protein